MTIKLAPSLLAADILRLGEEIERAEAAGADFLHFDIMDGVYVPNISYGFSILRRIADVSRVPLDVHMMTSCPDKYIDVLKLSGASSVTVHSDVLPEEGTVETLCAIRSAGMSPGLSLRPGCPLEDAVPFIPYVDKLLVMTVEPGFGGQKFRPAMLPKIRGLRDLCDGIAPACEIEVDGGIGTATIADAARAGANIFVVGTASFRAPDMGAAMTALRQLASSAYVG